MGRRRATRLSPTAPTPPPRRAGAGERTATNRHRHASAPLSAPATTRRGVRRAARSLLALPLAAGVVGLLRHRRERDRIRRGLDPLLHPAAVTPPPPREDAVSRRLAVWVPPRPTSHVGRLLAVVWAGPGTLVGAALGATTGGRWRRDHTHGFWVVEGGLRGAARLQRALGFEANAIGQVVLCTYPVGSPALLAHEAVHVRQQEWLGVFQLPLYLLLLGRWGYRDHPLERAARLRAATVCEHAAVR